VRELERLFWNPGPQQWEELGSFVGYLKGIEPDIQLICRKPVKLRALSYVDSNYATDKEVQRSISGRIHTLGGKRINWMSKIQASVTLLSTEAQYTILASGATQISEVCATTSSRNCRLQNSRDPYGGQHWSNILGEESTSGKLH
jgi:hypothetical protein